MKAKRLALVTNANSGIGEKIAYLLAMEGYDLALCASQLDGLDRVAQKCKVFGGEIFFEDLDFDSKGQCEAFIFVVLLRYKKIDLLFDNEGVLSDFERVVLV